MCVESRLVVYRQGWCVCVASRSLRMEMAERVVAAEVRRIACTVHGRVLQDRSLNIITYCREAGSEPLMHHGVDRKRLATTHQELVRSQSYPVHSCWRAREEDLSICGVYL